MQTALSPETVWRSVELSDSPIALLLRGRREHATIDFCGEATLSELFSTLEVRGEIKRGQVERAQAEASRWRLEQMHSAIQSVVIWWRENPEVKLWQVGVSLPPDVCFVLWFRHDTAEFLGGFESRNQLVLSYQRGKEFFGGDWEPIPDPNASL
ncbi:MAG: hypothetical protein ACT4NL_04890 [Pseudomarimonas sp.]